MATDWLVIPSELGGIKVTASGESGSLEALLTETSSMVVIRPDTASPSWSETVSIGVDGRPPKNERWPQLDGTRGVLVPNSAGFLATLLSARTAVSVRVFERGASRSRLIVLDVTKLAPEDRAQIQGFVALQSRKATPEKPRSLLVR